MNSTRLTSLLALVAITAGLTILTSADALWLTVLGAVLVAGSAIALTRHFWRENDRKRRQTAASYESALSAAVDSVRTLSGQEHQELVSQVEANRSRIDEFSRGILEYVTQLEMDLVNLTERFEDSNTQLLKRITVSDRLVSKSRDSIVKQLSAILGLYHRFQPQAPFPAFGGWAIGGECAELLVDIVLKGKPRSIVEVGSGLSTLLMATALESNGEGRILSLEHDPMWLAKSLDMLKEHGLEERAEVVLAPLVDTMLDGETFRWYDLSRADLPPEIDLLFIDGPPEQTGHMARYPALPLMYDRLPQGGIVVMDDASRDDEQAAVHRWVAEFPDLSAQFHKDSKGTVEIIKGKR